MSRTQWTMVGRPKKARPVAIVALCRCERGHTQQVPIDVRPPPDCQQCEREDAAADGCMQPMAAKQESA